MLELAVLGLLHESPMHGYELRKRLNTVLGTFRAFSYGSLYPCLKDLLARGWIVEDDAAERSATRRAGGRSKIVYRLTAEGKEHFQDLLADSGPAAWEDEELRRPPRLLRPDRRRRAAADPRGPAQPARGAARQRCASRWPAPASGSTRYTLELQRHGLESVEREVRWLNELIATERTSVTTEERRGEQPGRPETVRANPATGERQGVAAMGSVRVAIVGVGQLRLVARPGRRVLQGRRPRRHASPA